jgi:hypothetical protein
VGIEASGGMEKAAATMSGDQLAEYADELVLYEIGMLCRAVGAALGTSGEIWPMNVAIESFALHLRNLLDFLYPSWRPSGRTELLTSSQGRAHKEVAHLTTARHTEITEKLWDLPAICRDLLPGLGALGKSAETLDPRFPTKTDALFARIRAWSGI